MKQRFVDPFSPNIPIDDPERFFGRGESVNEMIDTLFKLKILIPSTQLLQVIVELVNLHC